jgi:3-phenylpropionate/trans-cinnamate dioxygenase ferredoxin reductase subunit
MTESVLIVGAGHAGGQVAALLRQYGFAGPITLIGDEPFAPYQRPPLSKAWLSGKADLASLQLKPDSFYPQQNITLLTGTTATAIDRADRLVRLADGATLPYDHLILATGARSRTLPGAPAHALALRGIADAERVKAALRPGQRLVMIGGGYIGLEVAASAQALGATSVVIEREPRLLARVASATLSHFFQQRHESHGVRFHLGAEIAAIGPGSVRLSDGQVILYDALLIGVGAIANDGLAQAAGLTCDHGVVVDDRARSSDAAIFAIGDVARRPLPLYGRSGRLESVPNALEQAKIVAATITGRPLPPPEVPWFWSDQYEFKLQIAGLPFDCDRQLVRGDPASGQFAVFHLDQDVIKAVEAINAPPEFMVGKTLIGQGKPIDLTRLADLGISMREML